MTLIKSIQQALTDGLKRSLKITGTVQQRLSTKTVVKSQKSGISLRLNPDSGKTSRRRKNEKARTTSQLKRVTRLGQMTMLSRRHSLKRRAVRR